MKHSKPIVAVTVGGNACGKTTNERVCGYIVPQLFNGEDVGEYRITGLSGYIEAEIWVEAGNYVARLGDPLDMDCERRSLPGTFPSLRGAVSAVARLALVARANRPTYFKYGEAARQTGRG